MNSVEREFVRSVALIGPDYSEGTGTLGLLGSLSASAQKWDYPSRAMFELAIDELIQPQPQVGPCLFEGCEGLDCEGCGSPVGTDHKVYWFDQDFGLSVCGEACAILYEQRGR